MSSLLKLFFEDSLSDDDDFEMMLALFAATMSNKRPKHGGSLRRHALFCRKKASHAKLMEDQSQLPPHIDQSGHCCLAASSRGEALFQTGENLAHLAMMERVFGPLPYHMLKMAGRHSAKYIREGRLNWPGGCTSLERMKAVTKLPRLQSAGDIIDLLQGLLKYDPANRMTAQEALRHRFFTEEF